MAMDRVLGKFRNIRRKKKDQEMIDQNSSHQGFKIVHGDIDDDLRKAILYIQLYIYFNSRLLINFLICV